MNWSDEEEAQLRAVFRRTLGPWEEVALLVADRAVELVAARGGTVTAHRVELKLGYLTRDAGTLAVVEELRQHISAQGARNATLERDVLDARAERDAARDDLTAARARNAALEHAATKAAAELRHTYGHLALGQSIDPNLVAKAIRILEEATKP